jgi:hypothetical protein
MASGDVNRTGTGFVNLNQYLNANQNNDLANTVSSGLQGDVNSVNSGLQNAQSQFTNAADQGQLDTSANQQQANSILNNAQNATAGTPLSSQDLSNWNNLTSGSYSGPQDLTNYGLSNLQGQASGLQQAAAAGGTAAGRQGLLQDYVGGPGYTQGQQTLDNALLGASAGNQFNQARQAASGLTNTINQANTNDQNLAQTYTNQANQFTAANKAAANNALNNFNAGLTNDVTNANNAQNTAYQNLVSQLQNPSSLTAAQIAQLNAANPGLNLSQGENLYGVNLLNGIQPVVGTNGQTTYGTNGQFLSEATPLGTQNLVTPNIAAQANALSTLAGQANPLGTLDPNALPTGYNTAATTSPYSFNTSGLNTALQQGQANYQTALNAPLNNLTGEYAAFNGMTPQQAITAVQNAQIQFPGVNQTNLPAQQAAGISALNTILAQRNNQVGSEFGGTIGGPINNVAGLTANLNGVPLTNSQAQTTPNAPAATGGAKASNFSNLGNILGS